MGLLQQHADDYMDSHPSPEALLVFLGRNDDDW